MVFYPRSVVVHQFTRVESERLCDCGSDGQCYLSNPVQFQCLSQYEPYWDYLSLLAIFSVSHSWNKIPWRVCLCMFFDLTVLISAFGKATKLENDLKDNSKTRQGALRLFMDIPW